MTRLALLGALSAVALAGCVSVEIREPMEFGPPPASHEAAIRSYFERTLRDPSSAQYVFSGVQRAYCQRGMFEGPGLEWQGWASEVTINAKNGYGGYTGPQVFTVVFRGGVAFDDYEGAAFGYSSGRCKMVG